MNNPMIAAGLVVAVAAVAIGWIVVRVAIRREKAAMASAMIKKHGIGTTGDWTRLANTTLDAVGDGFLIDADGGVLAVRGFAVEQLCEFEGAYRLRKGPLGPVLQRAELQNGEISSHIEWRDVGLADTPHLYAALRGATHGKEGA